jgi:intein/homing endonuclease
VRNLLKRVKPDARTIAKLPDQEGAELLTHLEALEFEQRTNKIKTLYPETGPLRRELYPKHMDFFSAGRKYRERAAISGNRVGKTFGIGGYETTLHLTGEYPDWWNGKRFNKPVDCWSAGDTSETTRDILQVTFLGNPGEMGTGLIPQSCIIGNPTHRAGVAGAVDTLRVKHKSGGTSTLGFKCFAAGTKIKMADGSIIPIEKIALGQEVACSDSQAGVVSATHSYHNTPLLKISTRLGHITVTPNHKMFTQRGKIEASDLTSGDALELGAYSRVFEPITSIFSAPPGDSYCVTVEPHHELIADGYRVGNSYDQGRKKFQGTAKDVCVAEGELVQMADGSLKPIEDVVVGDEVLSISFRGELVSRKVTGVHDNGLKECIEIMPKLGPTIILTPDHGVYWAYWSTTKTTADLCDVIANPHPGIFWPSNTSDKSDAFYVWAGLAISEGYFKERKISNGNIEIMERAISMLPNNARVRRVNFKTTKHVPDWKLYWDEFWESIPNGLSYEQRIPNWIFTSSKEKVIIFLRWLYFGDGWASGKHIGYASTSRTLVNQLSILLSRLGIRSAVYIKNLDKHGWREQYWVLIGKSDDVIKFIDDVGIEGKEEACKKVREEAYRRFVSKKKRASHLRKSVEGMSADLIEKNWKADNRSSKVRNKRTVGAKRVYDISVEKEHRFICNNSLISNCFLDEEPPIDVYTECLTRLMTRDGIMICTFTPLEGLSDVVLMYLPEMAPNVAGLPGDFDGEDDY